MSSARDASSATRRSNGRAPRRFHRIKSALVKQTPPGPLLRVWQVHAQLALSPAPPEASSLLLTNANKATAGCASHLSQHVQRAAGTLLTSPKRKDETESEANPPYCCMVSCHDSNKAKEEDPFVKFCIFPAKAHQKDRR